MTTIIYKSEQDRKVAESKTMQVQSLRDVLNFERDLEEAYKKHLKQSHSIAIETNEQANNTVTFSVTVKLEKIDFDVYAS